VTSLTETDVLRELAWIDVETTPPDDPDQHKLMSDEEFDHDVELAAQGRWEEIGLDDLPADWQQASIEDLRNGT
jgi:hypothetical protein